MKITIMLLGAVAAATGTVAKDTFKFISQTGNRVNSRAVTFPYKEQGEDQQCISIDEPFIAGRFKLGDGTTAASQDYCVYVFQQNTERDCSGCPDLQMNIPKGSTHDTSLGPGYAFVVRAGLCLPEVPCPIPAPGEKEIPPE